MNSTMMGSLRTHGTVIIQTTKWEMNRLQGVVYERLYGLYGLYEMVRD
jgi:hypothetical protein